MCDIATFPVYAIFAVSGSVNESTSKDLPRTAKRGGESGKYITDQCSLCTSCIAAISYPTKYCILRNFEQ